MYHAKSGSVLTTDKVLSADDQDILFARCWQLIRRCELKAAPNGVLDSSPKNQSDPFKYEFRDPLMLILALECGLRASEVLSLVAGDFRPDSRSLFIRTLKGGRAREIPLKGKTSTYLEKWILRRSGAKNLGEVPSTLQIFPITYNSYHRAWSMLRPNPKRRSHSLRHAFAVNLYTRSKDIRLVQQAIGHRSISSTQVYLDFCYSQNELRRHLHGD